MGVSAHAGDSTMVFSLWQGDVCTGTFRLPASEAAGLISVLAYGMTETLSNQPPPNPDQPEPLRKVLAGFVRQLLGRRSVPTDTHLRLLK
jgi:hypothetical protein